MKFNPFTGVCQRTAVGPQVLLPWRGIVELVCPSLAKIGTHQMRRFFPSHYAPMVSDLVGLADLQPEFNLGQPFHPFEQVHRRQGSIEYTHLLVLQLLSVLPAASKSLLPLPYQDLMTNSQSPILDFYPLDFRTDLNGKKAEWEAIVLIPFIDQASRQCQVVFTPANQRFRIVCLRPWRRWRSNSLPTSMRAMLSACPVCTSSTQKAALHTNRPHSASSMLCPAAPNPWRWRLRIAIRDESTKGSAKTLICPACASAFRRFSRCHSRTN